MRILIANTIDWLYAACLDYFICSWLILDWLISKKYSPPKPLSQMNWNFVGSTYGRFCIKFPRLVQIGKHTWLPWEIIASDWLEFFIHYNSEWAQILTAATSWQCWSRRVEMSAPAGLGRWRYLHRPPRRVEMSAQAGLGGWRCLHRPPRRVEMSAQDGLGGWRCLHRPA